MQRISFTAFYPSRPFWAGSKVNFQVPRVDGWFYDQMTEVVISKETHAYALKICRDGQIVMRISSLEPDVQPDINTPIEETVRRWGAYLDYLNAFYLLLDSATCEIDSFALFNIHEITIRDAFRVTYENGADVGGGIPMESISSVFYLGRFSSSYRADVPIEFDSRITSRFVVSLKAVDYACVLFDRVISNPGMEKSLASFTKCLAEYKVGNYETSIIMAWFIIEAVINYLWEAHIESLNCDLGEGRLRINKDRRKFFDGRDFPISIISNILELSNVVNFDLFESIDLVRRYRNKVVHTNSVMLGAKEAQLAMKTALAMIERRWKLKLTPSFSYSVSGL